MAAILDALWLLFPQPQTVDTTMVLRFSDDGGYTWSNEHYASAGPIGSYLQRVIWRQLGSSRDRVYEITSTAGIPHIWVDAYLNDKEGTGG